MRKIFILLCAALAAVAAFMTAIRYLPGTAAHWAQYVSIPALHALTRLSAPLPFSLLEGGALVLICAFLLSAAVSLLRRARMASLLRLGQRVLCLLLTLLIAFAVLWFPLYHAGAPLTMVSASAEEIAALANSLIDTLNAAEFDFSTLPADLPAKAAASDFWMDALSITGFFSPWTGEALYSPALHPAAIPFVAVHEASHAQGIAHEGAANAAAWTECQRRGGLYADSARLWVLRYAMSLLYRLDPARRTACAAAMTPRTARIFGEMGGWKVASAPSKAKSVSAFAAVAASAESDYEYLVVSLAGNPAFWYNIAS